MSSVYFAFRSHTRSRLLPLACYLPLLLVLAVVSGIALAFDIPIGRLTRDTAAVAKLWPYTGAVSLLGLQLWGAGAFAALATVVLLRTLPIRQLTDPPYDQHATAFLLQAGLLTGLLLVDDALMVHEYSDRITGVDNAVLFAVYAALALTLFWRHRAFVGRTDRTVLMQAAAFFVLSVTIDKLHDYELLAHLGVTSADLRFLLEDGFKLLGIGAWTLYLAQTCYLALAAKVATDR